MIIENYQPRNYGKEYVAIQGSAQYPMFMAVALGIKPCFDDWIPVDRIEEFSDMCRTYNLHYETEVMFQTPNIDKREIIGGKNITTTFAKAARFSERASGTVHVFISK